MTDDVFKSPPWLLSPTHIHATVNIVGLAGNIPGIIREQDATPPVRTEEGT